MIKFPVAVGTCFFLLVIVILSYKIINSFTSSEYVNIPQCRAMFPEKPMNDVVYRVHGFNKCDNYTDAIILTHLDRSSQFWIQQPKGVDIMAPACIVFEDDKIKNVMCPTILRGNVNPEHHYNYNANVVKLVDAHLEKLPKN